MKMPIATSLSLTLALGCASASPSSSLQPVELDNGTIVQLVGLGTVAFPGGEVGLLITYVTGLPLEGLPLDNVPLNDEARFVWWEFLPELRRHGFSQGLLQALPRAPAPGDMQGRTWAACVADSGETLWLNLYGELSEADAAASRKCARSTATFTGKPTLRITPVR
jgi:hypothetical protein